MACSPAFARIAGPLSAVFLCVVFVAPAPAGPQKAKHKGRSNQSNRKQSTEQQRRLVQQAIERTRRQLDAARKARSNAERDVSNAQAALLKAETQVQKAAHDVEIAKPASEAARRELEQVEADLEAAAANDPQFAQAKQAREAARDALRAAENQVLNTPEFQARVEQLKELPDHATAIAELRSKTLKADPNYVAALEQWKAADLRWQSVRRELFSRSSRWTKAAEQVRKTRQQEADALNSLRGRMIARNEQRERLEDAKARLARAEATIKQAEAALKRLESRQRQLTPNRRGSNRPRNNKKPAKK